MSWLHGPVPRSVVRTVAAILGWSAVLWFIGLDVVHAVALGAAIVALIGLRHSPVVNSDQEWPGDAESRSDTGVRREVARLSWSMQGYESRVQRQSVRRLYEIAGYRLGRHGLDLDDPRDYLGCQSMLGERAYRVVSEPDERPMYDDFVVAVAAVERLEQTRTGTGRAGTGRAGTRRAGTGRAGAGTGRAGAGRFGTGRFRAGRFGTGRFGTGRFGTGRFGTGRFGAGRFGAGDQGGTP